jgi:hypothetical protein
MWSSGARDGIVRYGMGYERWRGHAVQILGYKEMLRSARKFQVRQGYWSRKQQQSRAYRCFDIGVLRMTCGLQA